MCEGEIRKQVFVMMKSQTKFNTFCNSSLQIEKELYRRYSYI